MISHSHIVHLQAVQKSDNTSACEKSLHYWQRQNGYEHLGKRHHFVEKKNLLLYNLIVLLDSPTRKHLNMEVLRNV